MDPRIGRPHLGGQLGAQLAASLLQKGWVRPTAQPRRLELTPVGDKALHRLGIRLKAATDRPRRMCCRDWTGSRPTRRSSTSVAVPGE
jgi:hypothetical protein